MAGRRVIGAVAAEAPTVDVTLGRLGTDASVLALALKDVVGMSVVVVDIRTCVDTGRPVVALSTIVMIGAVLVLGAVEAGLLDSIRLTLARLGVGRYKTTRQ